MTELASGTEYLVFIGSCHLAKLFLQYLLHITE